MKCNATWNVLLATDSKNLRPLSPREPSDMLKNMHADALTVYLAYGRKKKLKKMHHLRK